jgi:NADPH:quinone reductase-like Zn-dependent oxidoreductase
MRAIVFDDYGGPDVLHVVPDRPDPEPRPGQVRVRVEAAGVNAWDVKLRSGAAAAFVATRFPAVAGLEVAGVVDRLGEGTTGVAVGDRVAGWTRHGYAERAVLHGWSPIPDGVDSVQAAAVPVAAETATRALRLLDVRAGETLLVHGASGGVGGLATQLAVAAGATVIGTGSPAWHDRIRAWGARPTTYGEGLVERVRSLAPDGVDAVLDAAGRGALPDSVTLRGGTDRVLTIADPAARELGVTFTEAADYDPAVLADVLAAISRGALEVPVAAVVPFDRAPEAHARMEAGSIGGRVVLVP